MLRQSLLLCAALFSLSASVPARADFALSLEYMLLERDLDFGPFDLKSDDSKSYGAYAGFDVGNSMIHLRYATEETDFDLGAGLTYERQEYGIEWNWNQTASQGNFLNTSVGVFVTNYELTPALSTDFLGFAAGGGMSKVLGRNFFLNLKGKILLLTADEEDLLQSADSDETSFYGLEAEASFGLQFGRKSAWSVRFGYRYRSVEFDGRFVDDQHGNGFVALRLFVPSSD